LKNKGEGRTPLKPELVPVTCPVAVHMRVVPTRWQRY
jgi:hypothetical protein